jgi:hypothetical protein
MNDRFLTSTGARWNRLDRIRAERLFRAHVDTPSNRRAGRSCRIIRLPCHWHPEIVGEAHHIDYTRPFVVAWVGGICGCHRRIDHGSLKIPRRAIYDYTSLIEGPWGIAKMGLRSDEPRIASVTCICGKKGKHNPHRPECPKDPLREAERMAGVPF